MQGKPHADCPAMCSAGVMLSCAEAQSLLTNTAPAPHIQIMKTHC